MPFKFVQYTLYFQIQTNNIESKVSLAELKKLNPLLQPK